MTISKAELQECIEENQRKIADLDAFRDDPKINKIIRVLQKQIARDQFALSHFDGHAPGVSETSAELNGLDSTREPRKNAATSSV